MNEPLKKPWHISEGLANALRAIRDTAAQHPTQSQSVVLERHGITAPKVGEHAARPLRTTHTGHQGETHVTHTSSHLHLG